MTQFDPPEEQPTTNPTPHGGRRPARLLVAVVVLVVLTAAIAFSGEALGRGGSSNSATITVSATGTVSATPNTLNFTMGVTTTAASAAAALRENNGRLAALVSTLEHHGVAKRDLQTSDLNIYPNTNNRGEITGFSVDDTLSVTSHDLTTAGALIDAGVLAVGNEIQFNGVTLSVSNRSGDLARARREAMTNARTRADQLARDGGASLGSIVRVKEHENVSTPVVYPLAFKSSAASLPIESGRQPISVTVRVVYALSS